MVPSMGMAVPSELGQKTVLQWARPSEAGRGLEPLNNFYLYKAEQNTQTSKMQT